MRQKKSIIIILTGLLLILGFLCFRDMHIESMISAGGKTTIGQLIEIRKIRKGKSFYFRYFINGQEYKTAKSGINYNSEELEVGKYYAIKFLEKYPDQIIAEPLKEITDTVEIKSSGFKLQND